MKELELMTSEEYWDDFIDDRIPSGLRLYREKWEIREEIMKLIKLLKDEIPDYSTRFTH